MARSVPNRSDFLKSMASSIRPICLDQSRGRSASRSGHNSEVAGGGSAGGWRMAADNQGAGPTVSWVANDTDAVLGEVPDEVAGFGADAIEEFAAEFAQDKRMEVHAVLSLAHPV